MRNTRLFRGFLIILLIALAMFDLHTISGSAEEIGTVSGLASSVLRSVGSGQICPVCIPEKVSTYVESAQNWNKQEDRLPVYHLLFFQMFTFLLILTEGSGVISEDPNLPHIRILNYIHRKDGKGPEKTL